MSEPLSSGRHETDALLRAIAQRFPNGSVSVFDRDLRYLFAAGEGLASVGLSADALIGRPLAALYPFQAVAHVEAFYRQAFAGESVQFELSVFDRVYHISAGPLIIRDGEVMAIVAVAQDITTLADTQRALEAALTRLEAENRRKEDFLTTLAREIRQPLHACAGAAGVLAAPRTVAAATRAVATITRQVTVIAGLVNTLLEASRTVRGERMLQPSVGDVRAVVTRALDTVRHANPYPVRFSCQLPPEPVRVRMDVPALECALIHVVQNAATHTAHDGHIRVQVAVTQDTATVQVRDTGTGIAAADLGQVFELFGRGANAQGNGFGIGLAVAKSLVEQHGGQITLTSEGVGAGTVCAVRLPLARSD
jgi:PAS domain S-box-containing protein